LRSKGSLAEGGEVSIQEDIQRLAQARSGTLYEKKGVYTLQILVAERKAFLSRKRLEYIARFRIDAAARTIVFAEMFKESGAGLSSGGGMDEASPGWGWKASTYKTGMGGREEAIEEQSKLFGKTYQCHFELGALRREVEAIAGAAGYAFTYRVTPLGL
jgi:hypothetical protein